jgi:hypothetical protein
MSIVLDQQQKNRLQKLQDDNRRLFMLGWAQLVLVLMLSLCVWLSHDRVDSFMGDGGPWGRPALQSLAVKNSFIRSTLLWLFVTGLMLIGFARYQKKQLDEVKGILEQ